jgi:hypothetical protein
VASADEAMDGQVGLQMRPTLSAGAPWSG